jgi:branched-chain amino acid transport system permease protein
MPPARPSANAGSTPAELPAASWRRLAIAVLLLGACILPLLIGHYRTFQFTLVLVYAIAIFGLNLLVGYNGQISIGHSAFYALGAYTTAILMHHFGWPYWSTLIPAALVCLVVGFLFGLPALRLEGHYLALATFALALVTPQLLKFRAMDHWTGGTQGILLDKPESPFGLPLDPDQWLYFFTFAVAILMFYLGWNLLRGRIGRAMIAIRDNPIAASAMGINLPYYKSMTFGISALYTGVSGSLGAIVVQFVAPDSFNFFFSISLIVGVAVGGFASATGAIYGALFIVFVPNVADEISKAAPWAIYGVALIVFMYVMPGGVAGLLGIAWRRLHRRLSNGHHAVLQQERAPSHTP